MTTPTLESLRVSAARLAQVRGHKLGPWEAEPVEHLPGDQLAGEDYRDKMRHEMGLLGQAKASCINCGRRIAVDTDSPHPVLDSTGDAATQGCHYDDEEVAK